MAEHWQQWLPFHIDRFRGSPEVQAMHPVARMGYIYLLASAWQTEDCTVSDDALDLASASGLGDELWDQYKARILRKFDEVSEGRLRNQVLFEEWNTAREKFESNRMSPEEREDLRQKRSEAGKAGNAKRWGNRKHETGKSQSVATCDVDHSNPVANDRLTLTGTETSTGTKTKAKAKTLRVKAAIEDRHTPFREAFRKYFLHKHASLAKEPWDEVEATQLSRFLKKNPEFTVEQWRILLTNRARSPIPHGDPLSKWIGSAFRWADGPTDKFGNKPTGGNNGRTNAEAINDANSQILSDLRAEELGARDDFSGRTIEAWDTGAPEERPGDPGGLVLRTS